MAGERHASTDATACVLPMHARHMRTHRPKDHVQRHGYVKVNGIVVDDADEKVQRHHRRVAPVQAETRQRGKQDGSGRPAAVNGPRRHRCNDTKQSQRSNAGRLKACAASVIKSPTENGTVLLLLLLLLLPPLLLLLLLLTELMLRQRRIRRI